MYFCIFKTFLLWRKPSFIQSFSSKNFVLSRGFFLSESILSYNWKYRVYTCSLYSYGIRIGNFSYFRCFSFWEKWGDWYFDVYQIFIRLVQSICSTNNQFFLIIPLIFYGMTNIFLLIFSVFCVIFCTFAFTNLSLRKKTSICIT